MQTAEFIVPSENQGMRLDQFLVAQIPELSRSRLQELIKSGFVHIDGASAKPNTRLRLGERVALAQPPATQIQTLPEAIGLEILFEDDDLVVLNKPPGMVVHPAVGNWGGTLVNALLHHCPTLSGIGGEQRPGIVHRLDKDTSGCIVVAKNDLAHNSLSRQFAQREVAKIYLALASGRFSALHGSINAAIGRHPVDRKRMTVLENGHGRASRTDWRVLLELRAGTLLECTLHSGRTHQIRVHLKHLGNPILGDEVYGRRAGFPRQMLHAWKLGFAHPRSGERIDLQSPIPADFVDAGVPATLL